ncbi:MAG: hypothetical protein ABI193_25180 [Minicystis sp.]
MKFFLSPRVILALSSLVLAAACGSSTSGSAGTTGTSGTGGATTTGGTGGAITTTTTTTTSGTGGLGAGECHTQMDCQNGEFCSVDILPAFCGGVCSSNADDCQADSDCADAGVALICDKPCACFHGGAGLGNGCTAGCATNADCGSSLVCNATHRCEPAPCAAPADDCTPNYMCSAGACAPRTCATDVECGGRCVNGSCAPTIGTCRPAVP